MNEANHLMIRETTASSNPSGHGGCVNDVLMDVRAVVVVEGGKRDILTSTHHNKTTPISVRRDHHCHWQTNDRERATYRATNDQQKIPPAPRGCYPSKSDSWSSNLFLS